MLIDLLSTFKNSNALNPLKHKFQKFFMLELKEKQIVLKLTKY